MRGPDYEREPAQGSERGPESTSSSGATGGAASILALQRAAGNRAVVAMLQGRTSQPPVIRRLANMRGGDFDFEVVKAFLNKFASTDDDVEFNRTEKRHRLYEALGRKAFQGKEVALLQQMLTWESDATARDFRTWEEAVRRASMELAAVSGSRRTREEGELNDRDLAAFLRGRDAKGKRRTEDELGDEERAGMTSAFPGLTREASVATDSFLPWLTSGGGAGAASSAAGGTAEETPLGVERRKKHKLGQELTDATVRYRTYRGTISPQANAFVLGGLDHSYGGLLSELVTRIGLETASREGGALTDRDVAALFLSEFDGADAFKSFSAEVQALAHKVVTIIFFAELSRHSIALITAAATFDAVASRGEAAGPGLVESFATGSAGMRPLFAGKGGPSLMRGDTPPDMSESAIATRRVRAIVDIQNYFEARSAEGEEIGPFIARRTLEMIARLSAGTDRRVAVSGGLPLGGKALGKVARSVPVEEGASPIDILAELGFQRVAMPGDENDCALYTIADQLAYQGVDVGPFHAFATFVRGQAGFRFGSMIDILNNGGPLLAAVQAFLAQRQVAATSATGGADSSEPPSAVRGLVIDVWSASGSDGLMEYRDVAAAPGAGQLRLTFYFNGINHFDSLRGGFG